MTIRLGIDVGGTNTDAVLVTPDGQVQAAVKRPTSEDVYTGVRDAVDAVTAAVPDADIGLAMLGTTQCTNAIVQRRDLARIAVLRIGAPATTAVPPLAGWPTDLVEAVLADWAIVEGGHHVDGRTIRPLDLHTITNLARRWNDLGIEAVAVSSVFSPVARAHEDEAVALLRETLDVPVSASHTIGSLGLLERENATVLNAALTRVARRAVDGFERALTACGIDARAYLSQNDGTLMGFDRALSHPVLTIGSGPTNSLRGGGWLAGTPDAIVIDVGGTTADLGALANGFPRESATAVDVGGVRTNFRMPDLVSIAIGGGTVVHETTDGVVLGPDSVGFHITSQARCFGGGTTTLTDVAVAQGHPLGDPAHVVDHVEPTLIRAVTGHMTAQFDAALDRIRTRRDPVTVIAVGGGAFLVPDQMEGAAAVLRPAHAEVANAIGAAMAEVSGEVDRVYQLDGRTRDDVLDEAMTEARAHAVHAGAAPDAVRDIDVEEVALAYLPGTMVRIRARAAGPLAAVTPAAHA